MSTSIFLTFYNIYFYGLFLSSTIVAKLRPRGWEGPGSGSENKCRNHLFI